MSVGAFGATAPYGNIERPFDVCKLAVSGGANFVARATVYQAFLLENYIKQGILKKGFAIIDAITPCPSIYSFFNKTGTGVKMMKELKEKSITIQKAQTLSEEEIGDKIVTGIFADRDYKEYTHIYHDLMEKAKESKKDEESL
jgi:2-oxoglutarate ferredoxin oxidoreductase subunit beta